MKSVKTLIRLRKEALDDACRFRAKLESDR